MIRRRKPKRPQLVRPGVTPRMPADWRELCRQVRARDKACRRCGVKPSPGTRYDVNHLLPRRIAHPDWVNDLQNLALLCDRCHSVVTQLYEPSLYRGDVLRYDVLLRMLGTSGPVPLEAWRAYAYQQITQAIHAELRDDRRRAV